MPASFGDAEFSFNRFYTVNGIRYYLSVADKDFKIFYFTMEQTEDGWRIVDDPKLPLWIMNLESELQQAILENILY